MRASRRNNPCKLRFGTTAYRLLISENRFGKQAVRVLPEIIFLFCKNMEIKAQLVKDLRDETGASFAKCREALVEAGGDLEKAKEVLKKQGAKVAAKKADRETAQGLVEAYIHGEGRVGVLLELLCETDFVAKNDEFKELAHDLAMHIAAMNPQYVSREEVSEEIVEKEKEILRARAEKEGKPEAVAAKMVESGANKFFEEVCLLEQPFIKDPATKIGKLIEGKIAKIGENIKVSRFTRFSV